MLTLSTGGGCDCGSSPGACRAAGTAGGCRRLVGGVVPAFPGARGRCGAVGGPPGPDGRRFGPRHRGRVAWGWDDVGPRLLGCVGAAARMGREAMTTPPVVVAQTARPGDTVILTFARRLSFEEH